MGGNLETTIPRSAQSGMKALQGESWPIFFGGGGGGGGVGGGGGGGRGDWDDDYDPRFSPIGSERRCLCSHCDHQ